MGVLFRQKQCSRTGMRFVPAPAFPRRRRKRIEGRLKKHRPSETPNQGFQTACCVLPGRSDYGVEIAQGDKAFFRIEAGDFQSDGGARRQFERDAGGTGDEGQAVDAHEVFF